MRGGIEQPVCWIPHNKRVVLTKIGFQATERVLTKHYIPDKSKTTGENDKVNAGERR